MDLPVETVHPAPLVILAPLDLRVSLGLLEIEVTEAHLVQPVLLAPRDKREIPE